MRYSANAALVLSVVMIILCFFIGFNPSFFSLFNSHLQESGNLIAFLSMIFSVIALFIASLALKAAIKRPKLELVIYTHDYLDKGIALALEKENRRVPITRPLSFWNIWVKNTGDAAARFPVIDIKFKGMHFKEDAFPGWKAVHHEHLRGWFGFQWSPEDKMIIHPGFPIKLPDMYFSGVYLEDDNPELKVTLVADGFKAKEMIMPIKLVGQ